MLLNQSANPDLHTTTLILIDYLTPSDVRFSISRCAVAIVWEVLLEVFARDFSNSVSEPQTSASVRARIKLLHALATLTQSQFATTQRDIENRTSL